uniref:ATP synthase F0 subunit 8 n=1 Tax=Pyrrhocoris tibialis TaxID=1962888 RepID=A0A4Y1KB53_9HEMI|nr:ATP synthase F0 subunit 8 [Pyrrhocoris tibialis]UEP16596.1 ATP synthase F0 subunit 8 [Pyrrhocoris tibialis]
MPQMSPLWWEMLYILTTSMMIMTSIIIYHNKTINSKNNPMKYNLKTPSWKW